MPKLERHSEEPYDIQLKKFSVEDLIAQLESDKQKLKDLGVTYSIATILMTAAFEPSYFEYKKDQNNKGLPTAMNCFLTLTCTLQPNLRKTLADQGYAHLGKVISRVAMTYQEMSDRKIPLPEQFQ